jgi:hypothetical protein
MRRARFYFVPLIALAVQACATTGGQGSASGGRDVITAEELSNAAGVTNAFEAVERLRPNFLRSRGPTSIREPSVPPIIVYLDQVRLGQVDSLRGITVESIRLIRHIPARDAQQRFGLDHTGGVIEVITMTGRSSR